MKFFNKKSYSLVNHCYSIKTPLSVFENNVTLLINSDHKRELSYDKYPHKIQASYLGLLCILATSVLFMLISVIVKELSYLNISHIVSTRNVGIFVGCVPIIVYRSEKMTTSKEDISALISRSTIGVIAVYLNVLAFKNLPLGQAAVIMSSSPVVTIVLARMYLKESCSRVENLGLMLTFCGVVLSLGLPDIIMEKGKSHFNSLYILGFLCAVGCVLARCAMYIILRKDKDMHFSKALMYFSFFGFIENAAIAFYTTTFEYPDSRWDSVLIMLTGIIAFTGHCILALAVHLFEEGLVSIIKSCFDILIAMIFETAFFNVITDTYTITGACLVILALMMIGFNIWLLTLPDSSKIKNRFQMFII